ncbi:MAG: hypothetical protein HEQ20_28295 [Aphanizomenon flos-aquae KM1D3_PB]|nr:MAG: hypothetical protein HEQ20_28295 [Aphanizomenon flos-aquae KM1D3_PB]
MNKKTVGFVILNINLFLFNIWGVLPVKAINDSPVFSVWLIARIILKNGKELATAYRS